MLCSRLRNIWIGVARLICSFITPPFSYSIHVDEDGNIIEDEE